MCSLMGILPITQAKGVISLVVSVAIITIGSMSMGINRQNIFVCIDPYIHRDISG